MKGNKKGSPDIFGVRPIDVTPQSISISEEISRAFSTVQIKENDKENKTEIKSETEDLNKTLHKDPVIYVKYGGKRTINLGNYESATIDISISLPVGVEITPDILQRIKKADQFAENYVTEKMESEVKGVMEYMQSRKK